MASEERAHMENAETLEQKIGRAAGEEEREDAQRALGIARAVKEQGGLALIVGGYARDEAMRRFGYKRQPKDIDLEVYGLPFADLEGLLKKFGTPKVEGKSFGVIKLGGLDISIPRRDSKTGKGHKGFSIEGDPAMTVAEAARRRDFTINAMAYDPLTGEIIDEFGGIEDIKKKVLRATDPKLFGDDPLRALRAMQFAGRFGFSIDKKTAKLCRDMNLSELPKERVGEEWQKLLLRSDRPSVGLEAAAGLDILKKLHPELEALRTTEQDPVWHPEGTVWEHEKLVMDEAAEIVRREKLSDDEALPILLAALSHDLGKPATTASNEEGRIISHGHERAGVAPAGRFLASINIPEKMTAIVTRIVDHHLYPGLHRDASDRAVRRLANRLAPATIQQLVWVAEADHRGRALPWDGFPAGKELLAKAAQLDVTKGKPERILMGRHLIALGVEGGVAMGKILDEVYEAQLDGKVTTLEEAQALARTILEKSSTK